MTTTIITHKYEGIYYGSNRNTVQAEGLRDFIYGVRSAFEDQVDAILVVRDGKPSGLWLAEPDVDYDYESNRYYEVSGPYVGAEYVLYRPNQKSFWNYLGYHFPSYVPEDRGFFAQKNSKVPVFA